MVSFQLTPTSCRVLEAARLNVAHLPANREDNHRSGNQTRVAFLPAAKEEQPDAPMRSLERSEVVPVTANFTQCSLERPLLSSTLSCS